MVTIKDIAERAGVSFSTVSKALRDSPLVQHKTKQHILSIAKDMDYQPNIAARNLVSKKSGAIGIVWPSIERVALSSLITKLSEELEKQGYITILLINNIESSIETLRRYQVDAILIFGDKDRNASYTNLNQMKIPILTYGAAGYTPYSTVDVNRGQAIRLAVRHLVGLGHRDIAYIGEPQSHDPLQTVKIEAFRDETLRQGLHMEGDPIIQIQGLEFHDGYIAGRTILERSTRPTAVISGGIDLTRGILRAVNEHGLTIPHDMSVVSYDNLPQMEDLEIPMTMVGVAISTMTTAIVETILELIKDPNSIRTVHLEPELVVRASTSNKNSLS